MTTVVLADDQEPIRLGLRVMLEAGGIDVLAEAEDGRAAVRACREHRPDVVLMDIRMPVLDGIAATAAVAASELPTRVLVLTTYDVDDLVYRALRAGAEDPPEEHAGRPARRRGPAGRSRRGAAVAFADPSAHRAARRPAPAR